MGGKNKIERQATLIGVEIVTNSNQITATNDRRSSSNGHSPNENGLTKIAIGALIGATLGGLAAALANRETTERISQTIRDLGKTARTTADNLNDSVQRIGDAVNAVAASVNDTTKDVNAAVNSVATNVSGTVKNTASTVRGTAEGVNETVKTAMNAVNTVKESASNIQEAETVNVAAASSSGTSNGETLYKLVPVSPDETK